MPLDSRLLFSLAMLSAAPLAAQSTLSVVVGGVSSNINFENSVGYDPASRTSITAGIGTSIGSGKVRFHPEVLYISKGYQYEDDLFKTGVKLSYVEVPLLLRLIIGDSPSQPHLTAGPSIGFNLSCSTLANGTEHGCKASEVESETGIKSTDIGMMVGLGLSFGRVTVSVRSDFSLSNISESSANPAKNRVLMAMVGITRE